MNNIIELGKNNLILSLILMIYDFNVSFWDIKLFYNFIPTILFIIVVIIIYLVLLRMLRKTLGNKNSIWLMLTIISFSFIITLIPFINDSLLTVNLFNYIPYNKFFYSFSPLWLLLNNIFYTVIYLKNNVKV